MSKLVDPFLLFSSNLDDAMFVSSDKIRRSVEESTQSPYCRRIEGEGLESLTIPLPKSRPIDI
jgi:hypothetical protein